MKCKKLEEINAPAYQYYLSQIDDFNKICEPLKLIGIPWFCYMKIFNNGSYFQINNNLSFVKNYFFSITNIGKYFTNEVNRMRPQESKEFFMPNDLNMYDKIKDPIVYFLFDHNMWYTWDMFLYNSGYLESFCFSMTKKDDYAYDFYKDNNHLLLKFIEYFKHAASNIIDTSDTSKLAHFDQSFEFHGKSDDQLFDTKVQQFLQKIKIDKRLIQGKYGSVKLTKREIQCLDYLAMGHGMKGVAGILDLSPRTIEAYIANAKAKTGYHNKHLLLTQFIKEFKQYN